MMNRPADRTVATSDSLNQWVHPSGLPRWLLLVLLRGREKVPWRDALRSAATVPVVFGGAMVVVGAEPALCAALAALLVVLSERSGTTGQRALRTGSALVAGTVAMVVGVSTNGTGPLPLLAVLAFGLKSGLISGVSSAWSFAGMQLLVQMAIAGGLTSTLTIPQRVVAYVSGGLVALAGMLAQSAFERTDRLYRLAIMRAERAVDRWALHPRSASPAARRLRRLADDELEQARELIVWARPISRRRKRLLEEARAAYARLLLRSLNVARAQRHTGGSIGTIAPSSAQRQVVRTMTSGRTWLFVARLEACLLLGELLRQTLPFPHGYWILLTIALTMKPDFAPVFVRTAQRVFGTIIGLALGGIVVLAPGVALDLVALVVLGATIPYTVRRNYGWFSIIITPQVFVLLSLLQPVTWDVVAERGFYTVLGCLVVLVFGNALWPTTWTGAVERQLAAIAAAINQEHISPLASSTIEMAERRLALSVRISQSVADIDVLIATSFTPDRYRQLRLRAIQLDTQLDRAFRSDAESRTRAAYPPSRGQCAWPGGTDALRASGQVEPARGGRS